MHPEGRNGHNATVQVLSVESTIDIEIKVMNGMTALHPATEATVHMVIAEGNSDVEAANKCGQMALHMAANKGHESAVRCS